MPPSATVPNLILSYGFWRKIIVVLLLAATLALLWLVLNSHFFLLEIVGLWLAIQTVGVLLDILLTRAIAFYPHHIVKSHFLGAPLAIPTRALIEHYRYATTRFTHGAAKNRRESIRIHDWCLNARQASNLDSYRSKLARNKRSPAISNQSAAFVEFDRAVSAFGVLGLMALAYVLGFVIYASYLSWEYAFFAGYADQLPAWPVRLGFFLLALAVYPCLRGLARPPKAAAYATRLAQAQQRASYSALLANAVAWLGLPLFMLFGNKLDFYALLLMGAVYYYDFFPRLSVWEALLRNPGAGKPDEMATPPRRSLQISLALLGGLSVASQAGGPNAFRIQDRECQDTNGNPTECQHSAGHGSRGSFGSSRHRDDDPSRSRPVRRGGFGSSGGSHWSFGG